MASNIFTKIEQEWIKSSIRHYPLVNFVYEDIGVISNENKFNGNLVELKREDMFTFKPHFGWKGHIELEP